MKWGLPKELSAILSDDPPTLEKDTFITARFKPAPADLIFKVRLTTGQRARGSYMHEVEHHWRRVHGGRIGVCAILLHHGDGKWTGPTDLLSCWGCRHRWIATESAPQRSIQSR